MPAEAQGAIRTQRAWSSKEARSQAVVLWRLSVHWGRSGRVNWHWHNDNGGIRAGTGELPAALTAPSSGLPSSRLLRRQKLCLHRKYMLQLCGPLLCHVLTLIVSKEGRNNSSNRSPALSRLFFPLERKELVFSIQYKLQSYRSFSYKTSHWKRKGLRTSLK